MTSQPLFEPLQLGPYTLAHRVVMAPLTRMRATVPGNVPNALNAQYYGQRASKGGLIIAEASQVLPSGQGAPGSGGVPPRRLPAPPPPSPGRLRRSFARSRPPHSVRRRGAACLRP